MVRGPARGCGGDGQGVDDHIKISGGSERSLAGRGGRRRVCFIATRGAGAGHHSAVRDSKTWTARTFGPVDMGDSGQLDPADALWGGSFARGARRCNGAGAYGVVEKTSRRYEA